MVSQCFIFLKKIHSRIQVEVFVLLYYISLGIFFPIFQPFMYWKQCITLWSSVVTQKQLPVEALENFCYEINEKHISKQQLEPVLSMRSLPGQNSSITAEQANKELQTALAMLNLWMKILFNVPTLISAPLLGAWSDRCGRKPVFLFILAVLTAGYFIALVASEELVAMPVWWMLITAAVVAGIGGTSAAGMALTGACLSDISDAKTSSRNTRIAVGLGLGGLGQFIGSLISSVLLELNNNSFEFPWLATLVGFSLAALYCAFGLRETLKNFAKTEGSSNMFGMLWKTYADGLKILTKPREGQKRIILCIGICAFGLFTVFSADYFSLQFLFLRSHLNWENSQYTMFYTIRSVINTVSLLIIPPLISKWKQISDLPLIISAQFCFMIACLMVGFASNDWIVYATTVPGIVSAIGNSYFQSFLSKQVESDELGRLFQLMFLVSNLCRSVDAIIFNNVYRVFLDAGINPGLTFVTEGILIVIPNILLIWLYFWSKRSEKCDGSLNLKQNRTI